MRNDHHRVDFFGFLLFRQLPPNLVHFYGILLFRPLRPYLGHFLAAIPIVLTLSTVIKQNANYSRYNDKGRIAQTRDRA